jgi:transposase-like protein
MNLNDPIFHDETKARAYFEAIRWPNGPFCPHCGETEKVYRLEGKSHRPGLIHCNSCNGSFTVTTGGVMESSHIPLTKWALGFRLYAASKKGFSAHQLHRSLGITYKSAWFMAHRIREAMEPNNPPPIGGKGSTVESDETFIGRREGRKLGRGTDHKIAVLTLVERGGRSRSFKIGKPTKAAIQEVLRQNIDAESRLMTDEATHYSYGLGFADHQTVVHSKNEYARGDATTNTVEGFFSIFKRGMNGTYQHCGEQHLQRYLAEFDFRYSNRAAMGIDDDMRTEIAVKGAEGKRLTYHQASGPQGAEV